MKINILIFILLVFIGCQSGDIKETPTKGNLVIYSSETVAPLAKDLASRFEHIYTESNIDIRITSAREAAAYLLNDSTELIILNRTLNEDEEEFIRKKDLKVYNYEIAKGGYATIVNKRNPLDKIRISQLDSIFKGKIKKWENLGWKNSSAKIQIYIPGINSEIFDYINSRFQLDKIPENLFLLSSTDSIISIVNEKISAIALIGVNYYDTNYQNIKFLDMGVLETENDSLGISGKYFSPAQAYIYKNYYPLIAPVLIYTNIKSVGLASGFISFATGVQGQKVVLNNKLVPSTMPVRIIQINREEKVK